MILRCILSIIAIACFAVADVAAAEQPWPASSVLRARDLTPFGLLRLDMRPATMRADPVDRWTFGLALTENVANFDNTPDIGVQLALTN